MAGQALSPADAAARFHNLQRVCNGEPTKYERKHKETYRQALDKLEDLYSQYPPASPEVIEAHRRLGYPEHYIQSLESGSYKIVTEPPTKENGEKDWRAFEDFWSFDPAASANIAAEKAFDKIAAHLKTDSASGKGIRFVPAIDFDQLYASTSKLPDAAETARWFVDKQTAGELKLNPTVVAESWSTYTSAGEGALADSVMDLVAEKEIEVRYARRMALTQWMQARGDIDHWDLMDMMPRQRDEVLAREDESGYYLLKYVLPEVEAAAAQQIHTWSDFKELLRAQRSEYDEEDEAAALGGAVTEGAELQRKIDSIMQKDTASSAGADGEGGGGRGEVRRNIPLEQVSNQEKNEKETAFRLPLDAERLPYVAQGLLKHCFGGEYKAKWQECQGAMKDKNAAA